MALAGGHAPAPDEHVRADEDERRREGAGEEAKGSDDADARVHLQEVFRSLVTDRILAREYVLPPGAHGAAPPGSVLRVLQCLRLLLRDRKFIAELVGLPGAVRALADKYGVCAARHFSPTDDPPPLAAAAAAAAAASLATPSSSPALVNDETITANASATGTEEAATTTTTTTMTTGVTIVDTSAGAHMGAAASAPGDRALTAQWFHFHAEILSEVASIFKKLASDRALCPWRLLVQCAVHETAVSLLSTRDPSLLASALVTLCALAAASDECAALIARLDCVDQLLLMLREYDAPFTHLAADLLQLLCQLRDARREVHRLGVDPKP